MIYTFNLLRPSEAYMRRLNMPSSDIGFSGAKPLSEAILDYNYLNH